MKSVRRCVGILWWILCSPTWLVQANGTLPSVLISDAVLFEGNSGSTNAIFMVSLSAESSGEVIVNYATVNDSALANTDYWSTNGTLTFAPGTRSLTLEVVVNGDTIEEPNETFLVLLTGVQNATLGDQYGVGMIRNDEGVVGVVDHFTWEVISSPKTVLEPISAAFTARDALGNTVSNFSGAVEIRAFSGEKRPSPVVISEVDPGTTDQVEFANVSKQSIDISRWRIVLYDAATWPTPHVIFSVPNATVVPAQGIFTLRESGGPSVYPNFTTPTISWNDVPPITNPVAVLLLDASGEPIDFFAAGNADPARITSPVLVTAEDWNGATVIPIGIFSQSYQRRGDVNNHSAADWVAAPRTIGRLHTGMNGRFRDDFMTVTPTLASAFSEGTWRGEVTILEYASVASFYASDGNGHTGQSLPFELLISNDIAVTLTAASEKAQVYRPFDFSVTITNPGPAVSTGVVLTNLLPVGASVASVTMSQGDYTIVDGLVTVNLGSIAASDTATVTYSIVPTLVGNFSTTVGLTREEADLAEANNRVTVTTMVESECAVLPSGAISWWSAEGDANDRLSTNHGTLLNGAGFEPGIKGQAFSFDGVDDVVVVPDDPSHSIGPREDFSIEGWIKIPAGTSSNELIIVGNRSDPDNQTAFGILFWVSTGRLTVDISDRESGYSVWTGGPNLRDGLFHHVAVSVDRDEPAGGNLYVDGQKVLTFDPTGKVGDLHSGEPMRIGGRANSDFPAGFKGAIDELTFYRRAITSDEVASIKNAGAQGRCVNDVLVSGKVQTPPVFEREMMVYEFEVYNSGLNAITNVSLDLMRPSNVSITSIEATQAVINSSEPIKDVIDFGTLMPGGRVTVRVTAIPQGAGEVRITAILKRQGEDENIGNNRAELVIFVLPECISLSAGSSLWPGEGDAVDQSGQADGILRNGTTFIRAQAGRGFLLDGLDDYIEVPDAANLDFGAGEDFSIEAWIKHESSDKSVITLLDKRNAPAIVDGVQNGGAVGYSLFIYNGVLAFQIAAAPLSAFNATTISSTGPSILDGQFHHVAVTVDRDSSSGGHLYVDGQEVESFNPIIEKGDLSNAEPLRIGQTAAIDFDAHFRGVIDEPAIHRRTLSAKEVQDIAALGGRGYCPSGSTDRDTDGLPDSWEMLYGLSWFDSSDAALDLDDDRVSNIDEYRAGTNPKDNASKLAVKAGNRTLNEIALMVDTVAGRAYHIEYTSALIPAEWIELGPAVTATESTTEVPVQLDQNISMRFYRVRLVDE